MLPATVMAPPALSVIAPPATGAAERSIRLNVLPLACEHDVAGGIDLEAGRRRAGGAGDPGTRQQAHRPGENLYCAGAERDACRGIELQRAAREIDHRPWVHGDRGVDLARVCPARTEVGRNGRACRR